MSAGIAVQCPHRVAYNCTSYHGRLSKAPKRTKCEACGGQLVRTPTVWGVVPFNGAGFYDRPEMTYPSPELADAACPSDGVSVVRSFVAQRSA